MLSSICSITAAAALPIVRWRNAFTFCTLASPSFPSSACALASTGEGVKYFQAAIAEGREGVVAKKLASPYVPNQRGGAWRKFKQTTDLPCVVIGYRAGPQGLRDLLMSTLLDGTLAYAGAVELGIHHRAELMRRLKALARPKPAIPCALSARWVKPELFCTVRFCGWRPGGAWRDPVFLGWDK